MSELRIGSLFSGIGGLEYGLEAGFEASGHACNVVFQVELDPWCRTILARHWPSADRSICDVEAEAVSSLPRVDVICGGPPCQDFSGAGAGVGISGDRGRLIFAYERAVRTLRPRAVVLENVASGKNRWLPHVRLFLETLGYRTRAIQVAAADVGAPHRRSRIFVLGLADAMRSRPQGADERQAKLSDAPGRREALADAQSTGREFLRGTAEPDRDREALAHSDRLRAAQSQGRIDELGRRSIDCGQALAHSDRLDIRIESGRCERTHGTDSALIGGAQPVAESDMGRSADGLPAGLDMPARWPAGQGAFQYNWEPPRTIPKGSDPHRRARLKALGNAVVPHCGFAAARALAEWLDETN